MKKFNLLIVAALAMAGWSCQDEKNDTPLPTNPQEQVMAGSDVKITSSVPQAINIPALIETDAPITLGTVDEIANLPEGYELSFVGTLGREESYDHQADFAVDMTDNVLTVTPEALEEAYVSAIGKSAKAKPVYLRVAAYAAKGKSKVRLGGMDTYYVTANPTVTPVDLGIVIEKSYGLLGTINGWSVATAVPFNHSGADPYDDPVFTMIVSISEAEAEAGWWWKVVPESTIATGNWVDADNASFGTAVNGSDALEGALVPRTATTDCGAGCVKQAGVYLLTLDMENQSYEFVSLYDFLWMPGDANGWNHANAAKIPGAVDGTKFQGFGLASGSFKFTDEAGWSGTNYGAGAEAGTLSTDGGAGNLSVAANALYFVNVDTEALTYSMTPITSLGLIGDFNGWGSQTVMSSTDNLVWTGNVTLTAGQGFKVRMNDNWDINLGGDVNNLTVNGANIAAPESGTFQVTLDLSKVPYTLTLAK